LKRTPAETIVDFLSFSSDHPDRVSALEKLSERAWPRVLQWLDDSGLAFYFLQKLNDANATGALPGWALSRLKGNFAANQRRVDEMSRRFDCLNQKFNEAGIRYAVVKGLSLVPAFCPDPRLRYQGDFDYLVESESFAAAQQVLLEAGYISKRSPSSMESIFVMPGTEPSRRDQYSQAPHAVELHLDIWDSRLHSLPAIPKLLAVDRAKIQRWNGITFPSLTGEDAFLLQVLHACHHTFTHWIRMSCLFEIGYFLNRRASDAELWSGIEQRVGDSLVLREFVVVVSELAARLFSAPIPSVVTAWGARIRPGPRVWIEKYSRDWAFCDLPVYQFSMFPRAKLALFLHQQYRDDAQGRKSVMKIQVPSSSRVARIVSSLRSNPWLVMSPDWWRRQLLIRRSLFHALAWLRYLCEIPRWLWLNRARMPSATLDAGLASGRSLASENRESQIAHR
jgi:hypothetical protein